MEEQLEIIMSRLTIIENKLKKKEYDKTYRERNKEKLKEKINCQYCNKLILKKNIQAHYKSMSCRKFWDSSLLNSDNEE